MPTGYTADLHDGKDVTFREFALKCSRAMGAAIMQRDEDANAEIKLRTVEDYYYENVTRAKTELAKALTRSTEYWEAEQDSEIAKARDYKYEYLEKQASMEGRYNDMLSEVEAWNPPTSEHEGLKKFMIEQLKSSIEFDCTEWTPEVPARLDIAEYADNKIAGFAKKYQYAVENLEKQQSIVAGQNAWVVALKGSLA